MTRAELRAACPSLAVPMPRFRKAVAAMTLTEAVLRVLNRAKLGGRSFAVFVVDGRLILSNTETVRFADMERRYANKLVGTYQRGVTVSALVEDLGEWFGEAT